MNIFITTKNRLAETRKPTERTVNKKMVIAYGSDIQNPSINTNIEASIIEKIGIPSDDALNFFLLASAVYIADKKTPRLVSKDNWTRDFNLSAPTNDLIKWTRSKENVQTVLGFLTGDRWDISFRNEKIKMFEVETTNQINENFDAVCLFSGGLDSTIGAINLLEEGKSVCLVSHYDSMHTSKDQCTVWDKLNNYYEGRLENSLFQVMVRPQPKSIYLPKLNESTLRSRSFLFIALGLAAASVISDQIPLIIPENGFISLNAPMNLTRLGSCSTRTTHPYFLDGLSDLLKIIEVKNPITNPFQFLTKGEVLQKCSNKKLLKEILPLTMSCSHPEAARWDKLTYAHCGYCYPCIMRRTAIHYSGIKDSTKYNYDIADYDNVIEARKGSDLRALLRYIGVDYDDNYNKPLSLISRSGPLPDLSQLNDFIELYKRGLNQLRKYLEDVSTRKMKTYAGLP